MIEPVYSRTIVISKLIVRTFSTGINPASKAPPCSSVKSAVVAIAATMMLCFCFNIWYRYPRTRSSCMIALRKAASTQTGNSSIKLTLSKNIICAAYRTKTGIAIQPMPAISPNNDPLTGSSTRCNFTVRFSINQKSKVNAIIPKSGVISAHNLQIAGFSEEDNGRNADTTAHPKKNAMNFISENTALFIPCTSKLCISQYSFNNIPKKCKNFNHWYIETPDRFCPGVLALDHKSAYATTRQGLGGSIAETVRFSLLVFPEKAAIVFLGNWRVFR